MNNKLSQVKLLAFDVDGTLTDGLLYVGPDGERHKVFNAHDGLALVMAQKAGLKVGLISGKKSAPAEWRASEMELDFCFTGVHFKKQVLQDVLNEYGFAWSEAGFMGDDLNDLGVISTVGASAAPKNAVSEIRDAADFIASVPGGEGAAREWVELILKAQDKWDKLVEEFRNR